MCIRDREGTLATIAPGTDLVVAARRAGDELYDERRQPRELKATLEDLSLIHI